jgi:hypothetical protein
LNNSTPNSGDSPVDGQPNDQSIRRALTAIFFFLHQQRYLLGTGLILGLLLSIILYWSTPTTYEVKGTFMVDQLPFRLAQSSTDAETERQLVQTLITSLASEDMKRAVETRLALPPLKIAFTDRERKVKLGTPQTANIKITSTKNSRIAVMMATSADPRFAADVINAVFAELEIYNQIAGELSYIQGQLKLTRDRAERLLQDFVTVTGERIKLEKQSQQLDDYLSKGESVLTFPAFADDPTLNNLKTQLMLISSEYAAIAVNSTRGQRLESKRAEVKSLQSQTAAHANNLAAALKSSYDISVTREAGMRSDMKEAEKLVSTLEKRRSELSRGFSDYLLRASLAKTLDPLTQSSVIVIIDRAYPTKRPAGPSFPLFLILGILFGVGCGGTVGVMRYLLDDQLNSAAQIPLYAHAPCLAMLPRSPDLMQGGGLLFASGNDPYFEALGFLRSDLLRSLLTPGYPAILSITPLSSALDISDMVAALAISLAKAEKRTLVIDLNLRHPCMSQKLGIQPRGGLIDWLLSQDELTKYISYSAVRELAVIDPGKVGEEVDDLFTRRPLGLALLELRSTWDFILVAAPPLIENWHLLHAVPPQSPLLIVAEYLNSKVGDIERSAELARRSDLQLYGVIVQGVGMQSPSGWRTWSLKLGASWLAAVDTQWKKWRGSKASR